MDVECEVRFGHYAEDSVETLYLTDNRYIGCKVLQTPRISDHCTLGNDFAGLLNCSIVKQTKFLMKGKIDYQVVSLVVQNKLRNVEYPSRDCGTIYEVLKQIITESVEQGRRPNMWVKCVPCPWYSAEVKKYMVERDVAYNLFLLLKETGYGHSEAWDQYKQSRNEFIDIWRNAKKKYYEDSFDKLQKDPKKPWNHLKTLYKAESKQINSVII